MKLLSKKESSPFFTGEIPSSVLQATLHTLELTTELAEVDQFFF